MCDMLDRCKGMVIQGVFFLNMHRTRSIQVGVQLAELGIGDEIQEKVWEKQGSVSCP